MNDILQKAYFSADKHRKKSHYHDCHQIIFITKGIVEFCTTHSKMQVCADNILLLNRFENHSLRVLSDEYERYVLHINPSVSNYEERIFSLLFNRPKSFNNVISISQKSDVFKSLFERLIDEHNHNEQLTDDMKKLLLQEILIMIYRQQHDLFCFDKTVYSIQQKFESNCNTAYTLEGLAKEYNLSVSSLSHRFKKSTGVAVMNYLLNCRLALAKSLLVYTELSVGEIVERCGFADDSNFSRIFKKLNGISPTNFRKKYKEK